MAFLKPQVYGDGCVLEESCLPRVGKCRLRRQRSLSLIVYGTRRDFTEYTISRGRYCFKVTIENGHTHKNRTGETTQTTIDDVITTVLERIPEQLMPALEIVSQDLTLTGRYWVEIPQDVVKTTANVVGIPKFYDELKRSPRDSNTFFSLKNAFDDSLSANDIVLSQGRYFTMGHKQGFALMNYLGTDPSNLKPAGYGSLHYCQLRPLNVRMTLHELGHALEQRYRLELGNTDFLIVHWAAARASDKQEVSRYGQSSNHEDFAEFVQTFAGADSYKDRTKYLQLKKKAPARVQLFEKVVASVKANRVPSTLCNSSTTLPSQTVVAESQTGLRPGPAKGPKPGAARSETTLLETRAATTGVTLRPVEKPTTSSTPTVGRRPREEDQEKQYAGYCTCVVM